MCYEFMLQHRHLESVLGKSQKVLEKYYFISSIRPLVSYLLSMVLQLIHELFHHKCKLMVPSSNPHAIKYLQNTMKINFTNLDFSFINYNNGIG